MIDEIAIHIAVFHDRHSMHLRIKNLNWFFYFFIRSPFRSSTPGNNSTSSVGGSAASKRPPLPNRCSSADRSSGSSLINMPRSTSVERSVGKFVTITKGQRSFVHTVWKFQGFSVIQILRDINFGESEGYKTAGFFNFRGSVFCWFGKY